MFDNLTAGLFARDDSISKEELLSRTNRNRFSKYLPWLTYSNERKNFLLTDGTVAYMYELQMLSYEGYNQLKNLTSALKQPFPKGSVIQFVAATDDNIDPVLDYYQTRKTRRSEVGDILTNETKNFIKNGAKRLEKNAHIPVRLFRAFLCVKSEANIEELIPTFEQMLSSANLNPKRMNDMDVIEWAYSFINHKPCPIKKSPSQRKQDQVYTRDTPLRNYCMHRDTKVNSNKGYTKIGDRYAACLTPTEIPDTINPLQTNNMFGGIMGLPDDQIQHNYPFLYSVNIIYDDDKETLDRNAAITMSQTFAKKWGRKIAERLKEFNIYSDNANTKRYVKVIPALWIFGDSKRELRDSIGRAKTVLAKEEAGGWQVEVEDKLQPVMLISSMLGGLYNFRGNVNTIDRHYFMTIETAAALAPIQSDFSGNGYPCSILVGRKGQLIGVDMFAAGSTNHNFMVCAESGGGKSFFLGTILNDAYLAGEKLRIVDLGRSYEKLCHIVGGKFIDFNRKTGKQIINPLYFYAKDEEDYNANIVAASTVISSMIYSKTQEQIPEHEWGLVKDAVRWAVENEKSLEGTDAIYEYFMNYKEYCGGNETFIEEFIQTARIMAHNMKEFTSHGSYGEFFIGESTINIKDDDFVVIELDDLKADPELFNVVVLQMMNEITQDLYLSNRQERRFILFEEAPTILKENGVDNLSYLGQMTAEGYRRARKYGGSFGVVMQSIMDTQLMGQLGQVILSNAAYKFMLQTKSGQYTKAVDQKVLDYDEFSLDLLNSLRNNKPYYSEIFIESPQSRGVARLVVDPFRYHVNSTEKEDVALYMALTNKNLMALSPKEALFTIWKNNVSAKHFEHMTKLGYSENLALAAALGEANVPESEYQHLLSEQTNEQQVTSNDDVGVPA